MMPAYIWQLLALFLIVVIVLVLVDARLMRGGLCDDLANWTRRERPGGQASRRVGGAGAARLEPRRLEPGRRAGGGRRGQVIRDAGLRPLIAVWFHTSDVPAVDVYAAHAARYATLFPSCMLQLLNEPNHEATGNLRVEQTIQYVNEARAAIRSVQPNTKLLAPALTPSPGWLEYFALMWQGLARDLDPCLHLYPRQDRPLAAVEDSYKMAAEHGRSTSPRWDSSARSTEPSARPSSPRRRSSDCANSAPPQRSSTALRSP